MGWQDDAVVSESAPTTGWQADPVVADATAWSDVPRQALKNLPKSAGNFGAGIYEAVRHPITTAGNLLDIATGGLQNALPESWVNAINSVNLNAEADIATRPKAAAVGQFYGNRYGSMEALKNTLATDPVGAAADLSTILSGGAGVAGRVAPAATRALLSSAPAVGSAFGAISPEAGINALQALKGAATTTSAIPGVLSRSAELTNPVNAVAPIVKGALAIPAAVGKQVLGSPIATGVGAENIASAGRAGMAGDTSFWDNLTGAVPTSDVLDQARQAMNTLRSQRQAGYRSGIAGTAADTSKLDFTPISDATANVIDSMQSDGHWKIGPDQQGKLVELASIVDEWKNDPTVHTAMGLDALKQRIDALYPDSPMHNQVQRAISTVRNAVKDTIVKQSPEYAKTMSTYEDALDVEKEIQAALSLKNKTSADTALRKLQSLGKANADQSGTKIAMMDALQNNSGVNLMPAISGQMFNSWLPRSNLGHAGEAGLAVGAFSHPWLAPLLAGTSPKIVGASLYGAGRGAGALKSLIGGSGWTPEQAAAAGLVAGQTGNLSKITQ